MAVDAIEAVDIAAADSDVLAVAVVAAADKLNRDGVSSLAAVVVVVVVAAAANR